jgi:hypothetical protein
MLPLVHRPAARDLALSCAVSLGLLGCGWDYKPSDNVLPSTTVADETTTSDETPDPETGDETGGGEALPASYRFNCVDIKSMGDADESVFQVITLQNTWAADIANFKLNILIDLLEEDPELETGTITIRSGVGPNAGNQCGQPDTASVEFPVDYAPGDGAWAPSSEGDLCASADTGAASGSYTLQMSADENVYIYAEDDDGTPFNCSVAGDAPDAIPIYALDATMTMTEDRNTLAGTLTGCVTQSEALGVCSCLSVCGASEHPDCGGCPTGSVPLGLLLGGIGTTDNCSGLMGEPAFDIVLEFSAQRLGSVPMTCG